MVYSISYASKMEKNSSKSQNPISKPKIPEHISSDLILFKKLLAERQHKPMNDAISGIVFDKLWQAENPYLYVLDLIYYSPEILRVNAATFSQCILNLFQEFLSKLSPHAKKYLNLEIQKLALNMLLQMKSSPWLESACQIFEFQQQQEVLKEIINYHFANGHHMQATELIIALKMQPFFSLDQIALPLIFLDQRISVERYLKKYPQMQLELLKTLDSACTSGYRLSEFINSNMKLHPRHVGKFDMKYMQKMLAKLIKVFNIPIEECPNLLNSRSYGALNYLMRRRFQEREMTHESWEEMVLDTVKNHPGLQKELVIKLTCMNELDIALKMAETLKLHKSQWPDHLLSYVEEKASRPQLKPSPSSTSLWDDELADTAHAENFLTLQIEESAIYLIDTVEKYVDCIAVIENYDIVSFDAEWRPSLGCKTPSKIALLQLAIWDCVFLLDIIVLNQHLHPSHWAQLMDRVFCNPNILKIGFAISGDMTMIKECCSGNKNVTFTKLLDFLKFFQKVQISHPKIKSFFPDNASPSANNEKGLSKLCHDVLGLPLKKAEQFSDWERRPLRKAQITYAALDAYCLLQVHNELSTIMSKLNLNITEVIHDYMNAKHVTSVPKNSVVKGKNKELQRKAEDSKVRHHSQPPIPVSKFRVIVDNMLTGLGKQLRMHGADVSILENELHHSIAVKIALNENRCFLTTGKVYAQLSGYLPDGKCYNVDVKQTLLEQLTSVCNYFNISCSETDVFTRCTLCNCSNYLNIKTEDLEYIWTVHETRLPDQEHDQCLKPFVYHDGKFVTEEGIMHTGVKIKMDGLSQHVLLAYSEFTVCCDCGKIYWEGSHHQHKRKTMLSWMKSNNDPGLAKEENIEKASSSKSSTLLYAFEATHSATEHGQGRSIYKSDNIKRSSSPRQFITEGDLSSDEDNEIVF